MINTYLIITIFNLLITFMTFIMVVAIIGSVVYCITRVPHETLPFNNRNRNRNRNNKRKDEQCPGKYYYF